MAQRVRGEWGGAASLGALLQGCSLALPRVPRGTVSLGRQGLPDLRAPLVWDTRGGRAPLALPAPLVHPPSQVPTDKVSTFPMASPTTTLASFPATPAAALSISPFFPSYQYPWTPWTTGTPWTTRHQWDVLGGELGLWVGGRPWARRLSPEPPAGLCLQLRTLPTYQAMLSAAHELPEGSLIFLTDRQELYVRLRGGFRRVLVSGGGDGGAPHLGLRCLALGEC